VRHLAVSIIAKAKKVLRVEEDARRKSLQARDKKHQHRGVCVIPQLYSGSGGDGGSGSSPST